MLVRDVPVELGHYTALFANIVLNALVELETTNALG